MDKQTACCFTGHRDIPDIDVDRLTQKLTESIALLYQRGYRSFIAGGAIGFDTLAAKAVLDLKDTLDIKLYLVLPCEDQDARFSDKQKAEYRRIRELTDGVHVIYPHYVRGCMHKRNRMMVDNSSVCITYVRQATGGSAYTREYAIKKELEIIDL